MRRTDEKLGLRWCFSRFQQQTFLRIQTNQYTCEQGLNLTPFFGKLSPVLAPDRAPSRGEGSRENCMRMLAFNQSLKFSSSPAQDGSRIGPWEIMAPSYNSDREKLLTSTVCKLCNGEERVDANKRLTL